MDRTIVYGQETLRSFDLLSGWKDAFSGLASLAQDVNGASTTVVSGFVATASSPTSLSINVTAGRLYELAPADPTPYGTLPIDNTQVLVQGTAGAQTFLLTTSGLSSGQSRYALIQVSLSQGDVVRTADPTGGVLNFWNVSNPTVPFVGQGGNTLPLSTVRQNRALVTVIYGAVANTGSEIPPQPSGGCVPLYLVDLTFGQTTVTQAQILPAGPSSALNVPNNYPDSPFLAGLLNSHHNGSLGQAPPIQLTNGAEVQGVLPYANMSAVRQLQTQNLVLQVNGATGLDTNPGTVGAPFKTLQAAISAVYQKYDFNGFTCTINVANGTYNFVGAGGSFIANFVGNPVGLNSPINLIGNVGSPGSVTLATTTGNGIGAVAGAQVFISGFTMTVTGTNQGIVLPQGYGLLAQQAGVITVGVLVMGSCGTAQLCAGPGGIVNTQTTGGALTLTGTCPFPITAEYGGTTWINGSTITVTGLTIGSAFASVLSNGNLQAQGVTFVGTATGTKFSAASNGVIFTNGGGANYFPGTPSTGTIATGGQYL